MNDIKQFKSILKQGISRNTDVLLGCEFLEKLLNIINDYENTKNQLQQKENIIKELDKVIIEFKKQIEEERKNYREIIGNLVDKLQELKGDDK